MAQLLKAILAGAREEDKDKVSNTSPNTETEQVLAIENLSAQVEQTNLDVVRKIANCVLEGVMESWKIKGQV